MWILNTFNSLAILASALNDTFGTNLIIPNIVIIANRIITPNTVLNLRIHQEMNQTAHQSLPR